MPPLLSGKRALAPDLPLAQRIQIVRLVLPGKMPPNRGTEVGVQQLSRTVFILFAQTFFPERTAPAVSAIRPILPIHTAGTAVQPLHSKFFPIGAMVNIFLLIIRKGISFKFRLGSVSRRLRPDIKRDSLLLQHTMCQRKIVSGVRCGRLNGENIPMDLLQIWYGTVVWYPVKEIQSQIPPQSHICLDTLFDLPFRWDSVQISYQQIFYQHNRVNCWADISTCTDRMFLHE